MRNYNTSAVLDHVAANKSARVHIRDIRGTHTRWITEGSTSYPDPRSRTHELVVAKGDIRGVKSTNAAGEYERAALNVHGIKRVLFLENGELCVDTDWVN